MKQIFLFAFFAIPYIAVAQSKFSYDLIFSISGVSNSSGKPETASRNFSTFVRDSSGSPIMVIPGSGVFTIAVPQTNSLEYKARLTGGLTIGGRLTYPVYKNLGIGIGASISYFKAARVVKNYNTGSFFSSGLIIGTGIGGGGGSPYPTTIIPGTYSYSNALSKEEKFQFVTFNIPINVNYTKAKWQLEAGVIPTFIINSKKDKVVQPADNSEISYQVQPTFNNNQKTSFNLSINPSYEIIKNFRLGLEYFHCISSGLINDENIYKLKPRILSIKILYKIKY